MKNTMICNMHVTKILIGRDGARMPSLTFLQTRLTTCYDISVLLLLRALLYITAFIPTLELTLPAPKSAI